MKLRFQNKNFSFYLALTTALIGFGFILFSYLPSIWYFLSTNGQNFVSSYLVETASKVNNKEVIYLDQKPDYQPVFNSHLPTQNRILIPSLSVDTQIHEASIENYEEALRKGVWRVGNFGTPQKRDKPTILVAHRFGYLAWSNSYRRTNSFYNLPKLKAGNIIEITWRQHKYTYAVYGESEGETVNDLQADLILYTCLDLTGKTRLFKYARLLEI